ncbi:MAG: hypothetical protein QOD26_3676 [Betaproteobacteria bacterium]|nr:hypothetical protein [Betaproteobacteria bacterium]
MIHPLAYLALTSSLTVLLIVVGLAGKASLAAELGVTQGALLATFYAFSANTRSLILQGHGDLTPERLLAKRFLVLPLISALAFVLCAGAAGVSPLLALLLTVRRSCEWLAEVRLCELEVAGDAPRARRAFLIQAAVTLAVGATIVAAPGALFPALAVFALAPLAGSMPRLRAAAFGAESLALTLRSVFPYIGSTMVEGISTYVLRLVVFLVAGREMAGLLFTAFVLGGFAATLFANVLGPTLAMQEARNGARRHRLAVGAAALGMGAAGIAIAGVSLATRLGDWAGKPGYFWLALGLSLLGAAIMIAAQIIRLRLFAAQRGEALFGPDVLRNIAIIIAAPSLYFLVSPSALAGLYLGIAVLTLFLYWGAERQGSSELAEAPVLLWGAIAAGILLPLFFLLNGRVYHSPDSPLLDPGGSAVNVPLPLSLLVLVLGLVLLARYRHAGLTLATVFFLFIAMVLASVVATQGQVGYELRKFVLLFQFLVPVFGLVLGQMFAATPTGLRAAAVGFSAVLLALLPAQLLHSIGFTHDQLSHDVWIFGVYQHLQYVPVVMVSAWLVALCAFWDTPRARLLLLVLAPLVAYYAARSYATLAIALAAGGVLVIAAARWRSAAAWLCAAIVVTILAGFLYSHRDLPPAQQKFGRSTQATEGRLQQAPVADVPRGVAEAFPGPMQVRLYYWQLYASGIAESARGAFFGHAQVVDRKVAPSAHNYYLDFVYNFGVLAFLPLAWLIGYTLTLLWRLRAAVWRNMPVLGLAIGVLFALGLDNMFKVPMRQPYPGIFFFFLWGLLIGHLQALHAARR